MQPANDNTDPLDSADTALAALFSMRRRVLAADTRNRPLSWWRQRQTFLANFDATVRLLLPYL